MIDDTPGAIDVMNYPFTATAQQRMWSQWDFREVARKVFKDPDRYSKRTGLTPQEFVAQMDASGYDKVLVAATKMYSFRQKKLIWDFSVDEIHEMIKDYPSRLIGIAGYNPYSITESLREVEHAVKGLGFKGVYVHAYGFDVPINDRTIYPVAAKCCELEVPLSFQTGHSLEDMPSEHGRPILIERLALDFPGLRLVLSHSGWPWVEEAIAMAWKFEHVYVDISGSMPLYAEPSLVRFMDTRGREKTLLGTNGMGLKRFLDEFNQLEIREASRRKVSRDNAIALYKL